jgi:hypothetical protein
MRELIKALSRIGVGILLIFIIAGPINFWLRIGLIKQSPYNDAHSSSSVLLIGCSLMLLLSVIYLIGYRYRNLRFKLQWQLIIYFIAVISSATYATIFVAPNYDLFTSDDLFLINVIRNLLPTHSIIAIQSLIIAIVGHGIEYRINQSSN